jgi:Ca2+-binding EF-hand superfamily protein
MKVTKEELTAVFKKVDKNFDGKITFDEFATWWRLGEGNKLEALVYLKLKSL